MKFSGIKFEPRNLFEQFDEAMEIQDEIVESAKKLESKRRLFAVPAPNLNDDSSCDSGFGDNDHVDDVFNSGHLFKPSKLDSESLTNTIRKRASKRRFESTVEEEEDSHINGRFSSFESSAKRSSINDESPIRYKRMKLIHDAQNNGIQFHQSESEERIKSALSRDDLTGDLKSSHCLPTISGRHSDLRSITPQTLSQVMDDEYRSTVAECLIVDCRYPYEYEGGHIDTAENLYTHDQILGLLEMNRTKSEPSNKRFIIVFHCEFSSERGPKMARFLRSQDRKKNSENYPELDYPELYILDGGYKNFYEQCPQYELTYKPMLDDDHVKDLRYYRTTSKSSTTRRQSRRNLDSARIGLEF